MLGNKAISLLLFAGTVAGAQFDGHRALEWTRKAVALGPRPSGSAAIVKLQGMIRAELKARGWLVSEDAFTANTPGGKKPMRNLIGKLGGTSGKMIAFSGHYDTKAIPGVHFVGANDGGSSAGWLLEMARVLPPLPRKDDVMLVFFDGEEALGQWSGTDGVYGSRHLAGVWQKDGTLPRIRALFNVDMIGDRDLRVEDELNSIYTLRQLVKDSARAAGYAGHFSDRPLYLEDDHMPFLKLGVSAVDLIDFDYGPGNRYWHTAEDSLDKLSPVSFKVVGEVLLEVFRRLQR